MKMDNFIYKNLPDSGLGDRLLDLINVYVYSQMLGYKNFYVKWKYGPQFEKSRKCLKQEYLFQYINLPKNIIFSNNGNFNSIKNAFIFDDIVGAQSIYSFMKKYVKNEDKINYESLYFNICKQITMKNIPNEITDVFTTNKNITTIHLRRTDKISNNKGAFGIEPNELENLNIKTKEFINRELQIGNIVCIISDDKNVKNNYLTHYKNNLIHYNFNDQVLQAYIDFYCMMYSKKIFLSQQFSTFSITASLFNEETELYYPFNSGRIQDYMFDKLKNLHYFKLDI